MRHVHARAFALVGTLSLLGACRTTSSAGSERPRPEVQAPPSAPAATPAEGEAARLLALAREHSPSLAEARARVDEARAALALAESALRPRLALEAALTSADSPSLYLFKAIDAHELGSNVDFNHPGSFQSTEAGLTLRWNLWNGGRDALARDGAADALAAREAEVAAARNALGEAVLAAWVDLGLARELETGDAARVDALVALLEHSERRAAAGAAPRAETLSLTVRLAEAREQLDSARLARTLAAAGLKRLCGAEQGSQGADGPQAFPALPATLGLATSEALAARAELASLDRALAASRKALESERRSGAPSLDLEGRVYGTELDLDPRLNDTNSSLTLGLHWDLADGGARRARRSAAEGALRALVERRRAAEEGIVLEVESGWAELEHARTRRTLAETALAAAEETFTLVEAQYREGSATISRLLEVEADRAQSRAARSRAGLGVVRAESRLAAALGRWSR